MAFFIIQEKVRDFRTLEELEGEQFCKDTWKRGNGGGGISCVLQGGSVVEKAGVNISVVHSSLTRPAIEKMRVNRPALDPNVESLNFFAVGLSLVLHPQNPKAPAVHLNCRYSETSNPDGTPTAWWFGGSTHLTPS